jgi:hypothetical protein
MPAWRCCCRRGRYRYLHVTDGVTANHPALDGAEPEALVREVVELPTQPPGTVRLVFLR